MDKDAISYLSNAIKEAIKNDKIDTTSVFKLVSLSMEIMEKYKTTSNKKEIIIQVFKELLLSNDDLITEDIRNLMEPIVNNELILGGIIDMICIASKGEININKIKKRCMC